MICRWCREFTVRLMYILNPDFKAVNCHAIENAEIMKVIIIARKEKCSL